MGGKTVKIRKVLLSLAIAAAMLVGAVIPACAEDAVTETEEKDVYALIDEYVTPIGAIGEARKEPLAQLGAIPDAQTLAQFPVEPAIKLDGKLIDDLADLQAVYGDQPDIFGISHEVETEDGTYQVYEVIMLNRNTGDDSLLSSSFETENLFEDDGILKATPSLADQSDDFTWRTALKKAGEGILSVTNFRAVWRVCDTIIGWINGETLEETFGMTTGTTKQGRTEIYQIRAQYYPMIHYIYVRDSEQGEWVHTMTANRVYVWENHSWVTPSKDGYDSDTWNSEYYYSPAGYDTRLTDAVAFYQSNQKTGSTGIYVNILDTYTASATYNDEIIARIDTALPDVDRPADLVRITRRLNTATYLGYLSNLAGRLLLLAAVFVISWTVVKKRKKKA